MFCYGFDLIKYTASLPSLFKLHHVGPAYPAHSGKTALPRLEPPGSLYRGTPDACQAIPCLGSNWRGNVLEWWSLNWKSGCASWHETSGNSTCHYKSRPWASYQPLSLAARAYAPWLQNHALPWAAFAYPLPFSWNALPLFPWTWLCFSQLEARKCFPMLLLEETWRRYSTQNQRGFWFGCAIYRPCYFGRIFQSILGESRTCTYIPVGYNQNKRTQI